MLSSRHHVRIKRNILYFGYRVNFIYEGMLLHSFDRFYVVTIFELSRIEDLRLTTVKFDSKVVIEFLEIIHNHPVISLNFWCIVRKLYHMWNFIRSK